MRRRRPGLQVQLFPFLAVLLCMLGALILLLLVLDQRARQQSAADAAAEAARRQQVENDQTAELHQRVQLLLGERDRLHQSAGELQQRHNGLAAELSKQGEELAALQGGLRDDEERAARAERAAIDRQSRVAEAEQQSNAAARGLAALQDQVRLLETTIQALKQAADRPRAQPVYSLVPYKGRQGTRRRPSYVECINAEAVFRPDGARFTLNQVEQGNRFGNEVDRRARAVAKPDETARPYVLLVVRPSGIPLFYVIQSKLQGTGIDVGYELVEEDWKLDFADTDAESPPERFVTGPTLGPPGAGSPRTGNSGSAGSPPPARGAGGATAPMPILAAPPGAGASMPGLRAEARPEATAAAKADPLGHRGKPGADDTERQQQSSQDSETGSKPRLPPPAESKASELFRDWEIVIECTAGAAILHPQKSAFDVATLRQSAADDNPLAKALKQMVEQKQRRRPDARPTIRFRIHPDGLRTYYQAARAVEGFGYAVTLEIVALEDGPTRRQGVRP